MPESGCDRTSQFSETDYAEDCLNWRLRKATGSKVVGNTAGGLPLTFEIGAADCVGKPNWAPAINSAKNDKSRLSRAVAERKEAAKAAQVEEPSDQPDYSVVGPM